MSKLSLNSDEIKILFVEDEPDLIVIIRMSLEYMENIQAIVVPDAESALEFLELNSVDAVVSDHYLPGMLGIDLLTKIKNEYPDIERFLITGSILDEVFENAEKLAKPTAIFEKPLIIEDIIQKIVSIVSAKHKM